CIEPIRRRAQLLAHILPPQLHLSSASKQSRESSRQAGILSHFPHASAQARARAHAVCALASQNRSSRSVLVIQDTQRETHRHTSTHTLPTTVSTPGRPKLTQTHPAAPMPSLAASAENPAPRPVVVTTRPRPFQLVGAVIWNPPTASTAGAAFTSASVPVAASSTNAAVDAANRASRSIAGPAPMPTFKAAPAPSIRSLLSGSFSESPSASPASASAQQPVPSMTWQQPPASHAPPAPAAPSHPFPRLPFALQRPDTSAPTSTITNNGSASSLRLTSFRGAPTAEAGRVEGHEAKQHEPAGQTGRGHASSGIQDRTGTASGLQAGNPPSASAAPAPAAPSPVPASVPVPIPVASAPAPHPLQHQPLRRGKWTKAEEEFAAATIRYFCSGLLNLQFGTLLRGFLAQQLHCHPMRISKKLLPGTTFCGVEISRKLGRRAYSPRWCDSPEATQQKLDAEAHLVQLREAFVASVEEEAAASTAADDSQDAKSAAAEAPPKSAGKARRSGPVPDEPEEEEEMKEAEDLYSRVSNVTMESATSPPHGETRAGSPGYYQPPPPPAPHQRVYQQLQPPYYVQQAPYYVQQVPYQVLQQQRQALQQPQPFDGRKRSRDELGACSVEPRGFHHPHPSQQQPVAAATTSFGSRSNHAGADEAHARNFGSPMPERQRFPQSSGAPQFHHQHQQQQQRPAAAAS
ncbi:hypothetical protein PybrP1_011750, partial [[Pythium] brassicae (nom. inval.)]